MPALDAQARLDVPAVLSSRPLLANGRLVNEAFVLDATGYRFVHQKHFFPEEPGFHEQTWFTTAKPGFDVIEVGTLKLGVLLCTKLMFNERARHYGRDGADLIAVPRASGTDCRYWDCAAAMAAIVSGAYVISANRSGQTAQGQRFGGHSMAYSTSGQPLAVAATAGREMTQWPDNGHMPSSKGLFKDGGCAYGRCVQGKLPVFSDHL